MSFRRLGHDRRGLTLIELVLTLTILAFAGALVSGALVTGLRAWNGGLRGGREELVARIVLERIASQLRAAVVAAAKREGADAVAFDASERHLRFVTAATGGAAPAHVFYGLEDEGDGRHLAYREYPWPDKEFFGDGRPHREELLPEVAGFAVKVLRRADEKEGEAAAEKPWSPLDKTLPASVSVELELVAEGEREPRRFQMTVPLLMKARL